MAMKTQSLITLSRKDRKSFLIILGKEEEIKPPKCLNPVLVRLKCTIELERALARELRGWLCDFFLVPCLIVLAMTCTAVCCRFTFGCQGGVQKTMWATLITGGPSGENLDCYIETASIPPRTELRFFPGTLIGLSVVPQSHDNPESRPGNRDCHPPTTL